MASIVVAGDTSGTVTLTAPAIAGNTTLTLPTASGTLVSSGSIPAGGSNTQVQFNSSGALAGDSGFVYTGGNVGIGTSSPSARLEVVAPSTTAPSLTWDATSGQIFRNENSELAIGLANASPFPLYIQGRTSTNDARDIVINPLGGNIGIGTSSPTVYSGYTTFEVGSTAGLFSAKHANGNALMYNSAGSANFGSAGAYPTIFIANSVERMRIHSSGGVSIGNSTDPGGNNLSVTGTVTGAAVQTSAANAYVNANRTSISSGQCGYNWSTGGANIWWNYLGANDSTNLLRWYNSISFVDAMTLTTGGVLTATSFTGSNTAKAWVSYNGAASSIRASFNVSSVTRNSLANYTINFSSALPDNNYCWVAGSGMNSISQQTWISSPGSVAVSTWKTTTTLNLVAVFGNQQANTDSADFNVAIFR